MSKVASWGLLFILVIGIGQAGDGAESATGLKANIAGTSTWVLPHLFHLDNANTSSITITNNSAVDTMSIQIDFRPQSGASTATITAQAAPKATRIFQVSSQGNGFVGTAVIFCSGPCLVVGTWSFDFGGNDQFAVGIPGISATRSERNWASVKTDPAGNFALAVFNNTFSDNACVVTHFNTFGDQIGTEMFALTSTQQRADFAQVPDGFSGRSEVDCEGNVWVTTVVQNPANGFPTVGFPLKLTVPLQ